MSHFKKINLFLSKNTDKSILVKNSFWLIFDQAFRILLSVIIGAWTARFLGKSDFGKLSFVLSFLTFFQIITALGADSIVVRELIKRKEIAHEILGSIFLMRLVFGAINFLLCFVVVVLFYGKSDNSYILTLIAGVSLVFQSFSTIELWFQSNNKSFNIVIPKLCSTVITNLLKVVFIVKHCSIYYFAFLFSLDFLLAAIFLLWAYNKFKVGKRWNFSKIVSLQILKDSWPFLISAASIYFYTRIDSFLIKKFLSTGELGIYTAAISISSFLPMLPMVILNVINPIITSKKVLDEAIYLKYLEKVFQFFGLGGLLFSVLIYFLSPFIIQTLYGREFSEAAEILKIHVGTNFFIYLGLAQNVWIINENKGTVNIYKTAVGVIVSILTSFILIPRFGIRGAAISAVIVQFVSSVLINIVIAPVVFKLQIKSLFNKL